MIKELKYLFYIVIIFFFTFFTVRYYISDENYKKSYRSLSLLDKKIKEMLDKMSTEDLRQLLIKKNIIKDKSKTPDKLLKDIYMYSELCNINISK